MKLYPLAYACRLYKEEEKFDDAYNNMLRDLGGERNLSSIDQINALLKFLNRWRCRIPEENFPSLREHLQNWAQGSGFRDLPSTDRDICSLKPEERARIGSSYEELLQLGHKLNFQDTAAAKTLHALRPATLPIWDRQVKDEFADGRDRQTSGLLYAEFIGEVAREILELKEDVDQLEGLSLSKVPELLEHKGYSLVKLIDEYKYVTITQKRKIPTREVLDTWFRLSVRPDLQGWFFVPAREDLEKWLRWLG